jgi:hypothetical protein
MVAYCHNGHVYHPLTGCYECKSNANKEAQRKYDREKKKEYEYYNSQEYKDYCYEQQLRAQKSKEDFVLMINTIINLVCSIPSFFQYLYNTKLLQIFYDFCDWVKRVIKIFLMKCYELFCKLLHIAFGILIFMSIIGTFRFKS